ncbi:hypothetical protein BDY21DRAFT_185345 [Lineolata rhizophorae]|uniref:Uncharacterized protein n=1 Tax=Lineolata rhizophorae TaxID=578093 RepID=A0A6A6P8I6_9PEZI|nr:hypothetical protein BDY21DRAFT_185345 [Lineolata rhizophorae]
MRAARRRDSCRESRRMAYSIHSDPFGPAYDEIDCCLPTRVSRTPGHPSASGYSARTSDAAACCITELDIRGRAGPATGCPRPTPSLFRVFLTSSFVPSHVPRAAYLACVRVTSNHRVHFHSICIGSLLRLRAPAPRNLLKKHRRQYTLLSHTTAHARITTIWLCLIPFHPFSASHVMSPISYSVPLGPEPVTKRNQKSKTKVPTECRHPSSRVSMSHFITSAHACRPHQPHKMSLCTLRARISQPGRPLRGERGTNRSRSRPTRKRRGEPRKNWVMMTVSPAGLPFFFCIPTRRHWADQ